MNTFVNKERNLGVDLVKIIAMLGVIALHVEHRLIPESGDNFSLASFLYKTSVISIPLFFYFKWIPYY